MSRASFSALLALWLCQVSLPAQANSLLAANGLVRDRRDVPLDPLDGIPEEDPNRNKGGKPQGGKSTCRLLVTPANDHEVADLRATVAVIKHGPKSVPCPVDTSPLRLRISMDAKGRIALVERLSGDKKLGDSLARTLTGQLCESTVTTPTKGIAQVTFRIGNPGRVPKPSREASRPAKPADSARDRPKNYALPLPPFSPSPDRLIFLGCISGFLGTVSVSTPFFISAWA